MEKYRIALTEAEEALVSKIDLRLSHRNHDEAHAAYNANAEPILALLASLSEREVRLQRLPGRALQALSPPVRHDRRGRAATSGPFSWFPPLQLLETRPHMGSSG